MTNRIAVEFKNVSKTFDEVKAVRDLNFSIESGQLVTLLGPSGCGKTTTLRLIAGLEMVTDGRVYIDGKDVTTLPATDRDVSMVFQSYALFPHMNVLQNVSYGLTMSRFPKIEVKRKALAGLELVGLAEFGERLPSELSGGQQQRVAIARALAMEPDMLLFDEPTSALDPELVGEVLRVIRNLAEEGRTMIVVTHEMGFAQEVSSRVVFLHEGSIEEDGPPREVFTNPSSERFRQFVSKHVEQ